MYRPENVILQDPDILKLPGYNALFVIEPYLAKSQQYKSRLRLNYDDFEKVKSMIACLFDEYNNKLPGWKTAIRTEFISLILMLSRLYSMPMEDTSKNMIYMANAVSFMENHFTEAVTIKELATQAFVSERHFSRMFKQAYQKTPGQYILNLRMHHACELLRNTRHSITEVALKSGFDDGNYFSRQFHKVFNTTPREYRARNVVFNTHMID